MEITDLMSVEDLAKTLKTAESTIYNWISNDKLPEKAVIGLGSIRIRQNILEAYYGVKLTDLITIEELSDKVRTKKGNIPTWFNRGILPASIKCKIVGLNRYRKDVLDKFLAGEPFDIAA